MTKNSQDWKSKARLAKKAIAPKKKEESAENLIKKIEKLEKEIESFRNKAEPKAVKLDASIDLSGYDTSWTWLNKLLFVLKRADRPLQSKEILSLLESVDKSLKYFEDKQKTLSVQLSKAVKYERIKHYKLRGSGGFFFCLPEWFEKGHLNANHREIIN